MRRSANASKKRISRKGSRHACLYACSYNNTYIHTYMYMTPTTNSAALCARIPKKN